MKRHGYLYEQICSMDNLILAHHNARKGKRRYREVKMVNEEEYNYLLYLKYMMENRTYHTSKYEVFIKKDGEKEREIYKLPYFPDRICQWAIIQVCEPIFMSKFISTTYSAIPGRGTHKCLRDVCRAIRDDNYGCMYCLKLDIRKYYPSIPHKELKEMYADMFKDDDLLWLLNEIIDSTEGEVGIPIGNYLSQYSGNLYLSKFDHWIKEKMRVKYYFRYMDDMVILHHDKEFLHALLEEIQDYLTDMKLTLKPNYQVFPTYERGIDFVGYRIFEDYVLLRKRTANRFKSAMNRIEDWDNLTEHERCKIASYKGILKHCDSYRLAEKYIRGDKNEKTNSSFII